MPKLKTNRGAAKRFKRTASGAFKHRRSFRSHILTKKAPKRKCQLRNDVLVQPEDQAMVRRMLPYR